jgi:hypothetical protein
VIATIGAEQLLPTDAGVCKICEDLFSSGHQPDAHTRKRSTIQLFAGGSMAQTVEINNGRGSVVGSFTFDESPIHLQASRTATGFNLQLPFKISLASVIMGEPAPMVSDIRGAIFAGSHSERVEIGRLYCDSSYTAGFRNPNSSQKDSEQQGQMIWRGSFVDLAYYNKLRDGGPVQFLVQPEWRLCYIGFENDSAPNSPLV